MKKSISAALVAACMAIICVVSWPQPGSAADNDPLIWSPSKTAPNAYKLRVGVRFTGRWETRAGADLAMGATQTGKIDRPNAPLSFWGLLSRKNRRQAAANVSQDIGLDFNAVTGAGNVGVGNVRRWIVTPTLDAEIRRSIALQCNAYDNRCDDPRLSQSARLASTTTGTAIVAQGHFSRDRLDGLSRIGVEQKFGNLRLGAAVADPVTKPHGVFNLRYALRW